MAVGPHLLDQSRAAWEQVRWAHSASDAAWAAFRVALAGVLVNFLVVVVAVFAIVLERLRDAAERRRAKEEAKRTAAWAVNYGFGMLGVTAEAFQRDMPADALILSRQKSIAAARAVTEVLLSQPNQPSPLLALAEMRDLLDEAHDYLGRLTGHEGEEAGAANGRFAEL